STTPTGALDQRLHELRIEQMRMEQALNGSPSKRQPGEKTRPTIGDRMFSLYIGLSQSTYGPTKFHRQGLELINTQLKDLQTQLKAHNEKIANLAQELRQNGGPALEGETTLWGN
ncbi:MAG: hypothetical protein AAGD05_09610, partial [Bacteroidota bacterium]